jgi:hypothetical protein
MVMEFTGHDSEEMTEHYTHTGDAALRKAWEVCFERKESNEEAKT